MSNFTLFVDNLLSSVSSFLLAPPISYFVGIVVLFFIAALCRYVMFGEGR